MNLRFERWGLATGNWAPIHCAGIARAMARAALAALATGGPPCRLLQGRPLFAACGAELKYNDGPWPKALLDA